MLYMITSICKLKLNDYILQGAHFERTFLSFSVKWGLWGDEGDSVTLDNSTNPQKL